jgi:hypothetical protein
LAPEEGDLVVAGFARLVDLVNVCRRIGSDFTVQMPMNGQPDRLVKRALLLPRAAKEEEEEEKKVSLLL